MAEVTRIQDDVLSVLNEPIEIDTPLRCGRCSEAISGIGPGFVVLLALAVAEHRRGCSA